MGCQTQNLVRLSLLPDKDDLVQAVTSYQADVIVSSQRQADLGCAEGRQRRVSSRMGMTRMPAVFFS
jgi:hypothetical protein